MNIKQLIDQIKEDTIIQETEVRTKIVYPLLDLLNYKRKYIVDEFPVYAKDGRKDLKTKSDDIMIFMNEGANNHRKKTTKDIDWVRNNSLIAIELKKPAEKIEDAKEQAVFYSMWTRCLIYIITNGIEIEIYKLQDLKADTLLFKGKIIKLENHWTELYEILYFDNLKKQKTNPNSDLEKVVINSNKWEEILFNEERDITDAIKGNKLYPYNIKSCPELPILETLKNNLEILHYSIIRGVSGCGKSISAYQLSYYYKIKGYKVFKYINNDDDFDYNIKDLVKGKSVFIIDDLQNIKNISIDKIIANTSSNLKFICTITDDIYVDAETTHLSTNESIKAIKYYYLNNKDKIYKIVHQIDKSINDNYLSETLENRLDKAEKEADSPWLFNYILRGGWNIAKNDYYQAKENNRYDWILLYIAINQISSLDKSVSLSKLKKILSFLEYDYTWLTKGLDYLVKNRIIIKKDDYYSCIHIRYASLILNKMSRNIPKEEMNILIKMIQEIIMNNSNLQGISWLLNEFRSHELLYYEKNIINKEIWSIIKNKCFLAKTNIEIRNSCFLLDILMRLYKDAKSEIIEKNNDTICEWINEIDSITGFALHNLMNSLLDYYNKDSFVNEVFQSKINFEKIANKINNGSYKDLGAIGYFLERLCAFDNDIWKKELINNINIESIIKNINEQKLEIDIWYLSQFISSVYLLEPKKGLILYDELEDIFLNRFKYNALDSYEAIDDRILWYVFGFSKFDNKRPKKEFIVRAKRLVNAINKQKLAENICNSNNHDWERYGRLILFINRIDTSVTKKVINELDLELFKIKLNQYWNTIPQEMRLLLITLTEATDDNEPIKSIIEENIEKIPFIEPILVYINNNIIIEGYEKNLSVDLFGFNNSYEIALDLLKISKDVGKKYLDYCLEQSKNKIKEEIENIIPMMGFYDTYMSDFINYISEENTEIIKEIFENINSKKVFENLTRYNKEKKRNRYANITLSTICKCIIKYNNDLQLKDFATETLNNIPNKYK